MSHYVILVAVDPRPTASVELTTREFETSLIEQRLEEILAPYDENKETEPYREYEDGAPEDFWYVKSLKRAAGDVENHTGVLPYKPDELGWSSASSNDTEAAQQRRLEEEAALWYMLPADLTWTDVLATYEAAFADDERTSYAIAEDGRMYRMSTYNPKSKYDYWRIGGRWRNSLRIKPAYIGDPAVIGSPRSWDSSDDPDSVYMCDGAPKGMIDFDGIRALAAHQATQKYAEYYRVVAGTPEATPWSWYVAEVEAKRMTWDEARPAFNAQPRVRALQSPDESNDFRYYPSEAIELYKLPKADVIAQAVDQAVPAYALVTLDGEWHAPGEMGWFGVSSDTPETKADHYRQVNEYLDALADDVVLVLLDAHI